MNFKLFTLLALIACISLVRASPPHRKLEAPPPTERQCRLVSGEREGLFDVDTPLPRQQYNEGQYDGGRWKRLSFNNAAISATLHMIQTQDGQKISWMTMDTRPIQNYYIYLELHYFNINRQPVRDLWKIYSGGDCVAFTGQQAELDPTKVHLGDIKMDAWYRSDDPYQKKD